MAKLKIGIVGCGAIGSSLARIILKKYYRQAELSGFYDIDISKAPGLAKKLGLNAILNKSSLDKLINGSDLIIEATAAGYSRVLCKKVLSKKKDILVMSVGGIAGHILQLTQLAYRNKCKVYVPSGAIAGIDALKAVGCGNIKKVMLTTTKPALAFSGVPYIKQKKINLRSIVNSKVIFEGNAVSAVKNFPQNINVAAVLSLAGIGLGRTRVRIVASSRVKKNIHEIEIESEAAKVTTRTENIAHPDNPKTSFLAVLSAEAVIKQILSPVKIGA